MISFFFTKLRPLHRFVPRSSEIQQRTVPKLPPTKRFFSLHRSISEVPENAEPVKTLLRNYGFTNTQIAELGKTLPQILSSDPQKTLLPKLEFYRSIGFSGTELPKVICASKCLLARSLEKQLIPCYNFLKSVLSLDENVVKILKRSPSILLHSVERNIAPNIAALREAGIPHSTISTIMYRAAGSVHQEPQKFKESINRAVEMGFNTLAATTFADAVLVLCQMPKSTWEQKVDIYRRCGLSNDEIMMVFRSRPSCMYLSEGKILRAMDFLVEKMGWQPIAIAKCPTVLSLNLEKRIIPRCRVVKILMTRGLVKKNLGFASFLLPNEKKFLDKFVNMYVDDLPDLTNVYLGNGFAETKI